MATATESCTAQIGETAGAIWKVLSEQGPMSTARLVKEMDVPRDVVMQALGWLAREDKVSIEDGSRARVVSLR